MSEKTKDSHHSPNSISAKDAAQSAAEASEQADVAKTRADLQEMCASTQHIRMQTDRIAAHVLEGQTTARRHAARTVLGQIEQILRNQALLISLVEDIRQRLPPALAAEAGAHPPTEGSSPPPTAVNRP